MKKIASVLDLALLTAFTSVAIAQMAGKAREKTVTLQIGKVILDMKEEGGYAH